MLELLKEEVCEQNHELPKNGLVVGSGGNVSGRDRETGLVVIKPSGVKFAKLTPETLVVVDLEGNCRRQMNPRSTPASISTSTSIVPTFSASPIPIRPMRRASLRVASASRRC